LSTRKKKYRRLSDPKSKGKPPSLEKERQGSKKGRDRARKQRKVHFTLIILL